MPGPWLDSNDAVAKVKAHPDFENFSPLRKQQIITFIEEGYMILPHFYSQEEVKAFNVEIENLLDQQKLDFNYTGKKIVESYKVAPLVNQHFFRNRELLKVFEFIFDREVVPFHTINFIEGSEQKAHSDSIHMSTVPEGFMAAAWAALEPSNELNGPLYYYPGSHRLPYISCLDYDSGNSKYLIGDNSYANYEKHVEKLIKDHHLKKKYFHANSGDVLIWHANLLHGGDKILEKGRSRKSMVAHYFGKDVLCFHEISQRPALLDIK